jgi:hypothetical protein
LIIRKNQWILVALLTHVTSKDVVKELRALYLEKKDLLGCSSASIGGILLKIHNSLYTHALQAMQVSLRSVSNLGHFT